MANKSLKENNENLATNTINYLPEDADETFAGEIDTSSKDSTKYYSNSTYCKSNKDDCNVIVKINTLKVEKRERTFYHNRNISKYV